ncbi:UDP-N-acetylmuramoylalanyl-D-glutamyl-2,6-diaminopimelate--D-alanyl-D-alanine ligase [Virgifigura deserti]|uniref:UDP-N-acetylmuramoylalanyl-D-glutamyl-2, 6-diaminopimelate--D-alanyl-D-alanine ligase n=1 Tax=Virgifigura deserti TaxID=2268457 RepID=UPI003CCBE899
MTPAAMETQTPLWTATEAIAATGGRGTGDWTASGVSIDSRSLETGDLFVALQGPNFDGHAFIGAALEKGAVAALASRVPDGLPSGAPLLLVDDTLAGLEALGGAARDRSAARFVAVTGSVGKTGTKEALKLALETTAPTFASSGNLNNHWGVPLSLARLPRDVAYGVFELGMNHAGEIGPLSRQVRPDVAIITTIEAVHMEFFSSVEEIADAKAEIFEGMTSCATAVLNRDNPQFNRLAAHARAQGLARIIGFGRHEEADARLVDYALNATGSTVSASILGERIDYRLTVSGLHWVLNSLGVLAAIVASGGDLGAAAAAMSKLVPLKGRGRREHIALPGGPFELIDESYNASPAAVRAAFQVLAQAKPGAGGRRIAVLGDMLELGAQEERLHADLAPELRAAQVDLVFTAGPLMAALDRALPASQRGGHAATAADLIAQVAATVRPGDVVLVKGSLGSRMGPLVEALRALDQSPPDAASPRAANGN